VNRAPTGLAGNSLAKTAPVLVGYVASFASAPIVLSGLGLRDFGIWALTGALAQYGALIDLGLGRTMSRYIAIDAARSDPRAEGEIVVLGLVLTAVVAVLLVLAALVCAAPVATAIGGITTEDMRLVLTASAGVAALAMIGKAVAAWPEGHRRMVAPNVALAAGGVLNFICAVTAILLGGGLVEFALANVVAAALTLVVVTVTVLVLEGRPPLAWPRWSRTREVLRFAMQGQVVYLTDLVNFQTDKIIIAFVIGPSAAGSYDIANRVCSAGRAMGIFAQSAMLPEFAARVAERGVSAVREVYLPMTRKACSISFPALFLCAGTAPVLLGAWLGQSPPDTVEILAVLPLAYVANVSTGVTYAVALAADGAHLPARAAVLTAVVNLALTAALAPVFGLWGVLAGTLLALSAGAIVHVLLVQRHFDLPARTHWDAVKRCLLLSGGLSVPLFVVSLVAASELARGGQFIALVAGGLAYSAVYVALARRLRLFPEALMIARFPRRLPRRAPRAS